MPLDIAQVDETSTIRHSDMLGFNFTPFFLPGLFGLVSRLDRLERLSPIAIKIAVVARKPRTFCVF